MKHIKIFLTGLLVSISVIALVSHPFILGYHIHDKYWFSGGILIIIVEVILIGILGGIYTVGETFLKDINEK